MDENHNIFKEKRGFMPFAASGAVKHSRRNAYSITASHLSHIISPLPGVIGGGIGMTEKPGRFPVVTSDARDGHGIEQLSVRPCSAEIGQGKCQECYDLDQFKKMLAGGSHLNSLESLPGFIFDRYARRCAAGAFISSDNLEFAFRDLLHPVEAELPPKEYQIASKHLRDLNRKLCRKLSQFFHNYRDLVEDAVADAIQSELYKESGSTIFVRFDPGANVPFVGYVMSTLWKAARGLISKRIQRDARSLGEDALDQSGELVGDHLAALSRLRREPTGENWDDCQDEDSYRARVERMMLLVEETEQRFIDRMLDRFRDLDGMTRLSAFGIELLERAERQRERFSTSNGDAFKNFPTHNSIARDANVANSGRLEKRYLAEVEVWLAALPNLQPHLEGFAETANDLRDLMMARDTFKMTEINWRTRLFGVVGVAELKKLFDAL